MNNIKAIIFDLDGTLLDDNKEISDKTIELLKRIKNDIKLIPASARQFCTIKPYLSKLNLLNEDDYTICFNGSLVVKNNEFEIFSSYIDKKVVLEIDDFILEHNIDWTYYLYDSRILRKDISDMKKYVNDNKIYKIVGVADPTVIEKIKNNLPKCILNNLEITSSESNRIEFVNKGMTKAKAIELVLKKLGIDKENIVAIGDGDNDISMIKYAGCGIAMLNSSEMVKSFADIVTKYSNNEDGVYYVIKELLSKGSDGNE